MTVRKKTKKAVKQTLLDKDLSKNKCYEAVLTGTVLAIDPSIGSKSSMPGYAWFEKGELVESGIFELPRTLGKHKRLYELGRIIREEFEVPDVLAVERIVSNVFRGGANMNSQGLASLHKAVGVVMGALPVEHMVEVATSAWRPYAPEGMEKSDERDSIAMGFCVVDKSLKIKESKSKT